MKKANKSKTIAEFSFRFPKIVIPLSILALFLCVVGGFLSAFRIAKEGIKNFYDVMKYPFLIAVCLAGIVLIVALLIKSCYIITEKLLISSFGLLKNSVKISEITAVVSDLQAEKATVYCGENYSVLLIKKSDNEKFIRALLSIKSSIDISYTFTEDKPPKK